MKNRLSEIRKIHRMNQQDLADVLEVTRQTIGSIENGRYDPSLQLAFKIARYFDMAIEEIFSDERGEGNES
ncbi:helix-turn-helix transcriptional regulator [Allobacillus sp. GCM10007491]|uniref:Helix-turn-helix transcriptional regulator n=1 Tax=Allobacillus saliphilus TaxID=2912308 RepID=A0A941CRV4_9BACI|nr:helix-turn-helix transcriptional regulator [Allobacillus saliphilus]MBR7552642.1 helix-turn-helix transcriptional regulator [Allobacillus saliphilus]